MSGLSKIISGGQTGVERAALDSAISSGIYCWGGWAPSGRLAEDGEIDAKYFSQERRWCGLSELDGGRYATRMMKNANESDGTIILRVRGGGRVLGPGAKMLIKFLQKSDKPYCLFDPSNKWSTVDAAKWICETKEENNNEPIRILNISGPQESSFPGIYEQSKRYLEEVFGFVFQYQRWGIKIWSIAKPNK